MKKTIIAVLLLLSACFCFALPSMHESYKDNDSLYGDIAFVHQEYDKNSPYRVAFTMYRTDAEIETVELIFTFTNSNEAMTFYNKNIREIKDFPMWYDTFKKLRDSEPVLSIRFQEYKPSKDKVGLYKYIDFEKMKQ